MIWALLALLGIPIWLIGIVLLSVFRNRKKVKTNPEIFECAIVKDEGWKRGKGYA